MSKKFVYVKSDNVAAIHYINVGRGRVSELADLAKSIRVKEISLQIESVAVHLPGVFNVTPDALSRDWLSPQTRDSKPDKTLRKRLFAHIQRQLGTSFDLDGMCAEDGHNKLCDQYCTPSFPLWEADLLNQRTWVFPPSDLIGITLKFLHDFRKRQGKPFLCILVPERPKAYWFKYCAGYARVCRWAKGSDLFRVFDYQAQAFRQDAQTREPWVVLKLE